MSNLIIQPRCEADREKCKSFVTVYKKTVPTNDIKIELNEITISYLQRFYKITDVECRVTERDYSDYRVIVTLPKLDKHFDTHADVSEKEYDMWYPSNCMFYEYQDLIFVLRFEADKDFKSTCR